MNTADIKIENWDEMDALLFEISQAPDSPLGELHLMGMRREGRSPVFILQSYHFINDPNEGSPQPTGEWAFNIVGKDSGKEWCVRSEIIHRDIPISREIVLSYLKQSVDSYHAHIQNLKG